MEEVGSDGMGDEAIADLLTADELQLALRNHGMPLEALRQEITPVGLHYLLTHYDIPFVDPGHWRLQVTGRVRRTLELDLDALRDLPRTTLTATMECAGNARALLRPRPISQPWLGEAVGTATWSGVSVSHVLDMAGVEPAAVEVAFIGVDRGVEAGVEQAYARSLGVDEARREGVLLALEMNGLPLLPQHGFPLRLVVPGWYGMSNVKWLGRIDVLDQPYRGYQQVRAYRMRSSRDDAGTPVTRMLPRALMVPPGIPDFMTRRRFVEPGARTLEGRAWSGWGDIVAVEVSDDGGETWAGAQLGRAASAAAWVGWSQRWDARAGEHELCCRATDAAGNVQPLQAEWNLGGYQNNAVQRIAVTVGSPAAHREASPRRFRALPA